MKHAIVALGLLTASFVHPAFSVTPPKPIVAVFDIEDQGANLPKNVLERMSNYVVTRLTESGLYSVVPRGDLKKRLSEQKNSSYQLCYDQSCQIELGREMAAQKILSSEIMKIGNKCLITTNLYDLKRAATEVAAHSERGACDEDGIMDLLDQVMKKITARESPMDPQEGAKGRARAGTVTQYDFLGQWDFLHSGNVTKSRDTGNNTSSEQAYKEYLITFFLNDKNEIDFRYKDVMDGYMSTTIPGPTKYNKPKPPYSVDYENTIEKVQFLDDLKVMAVSFKQSTGFTWKQFYALTSDKTKLMVVRLSELSLSAEGKLDERIKLHLVEVPDPNNPKQFYTHFTYAVRKRT